MKKITILVAAVLFSASFTFASSFKTNLIKIEISADSVDLNDYVGKYKMAEGSPVESVIFSIKEGKLVGVAGEYPEAILAVKIKDVFDDPASGFIFTFSRFEGKILKLKVEAQGFELFGEKEAEEKK